MTNNSLNAAEKTSASVNPEDKAKVAPAAGQPITEPTKTPAAEVTPPTKS